MVGTVSGGSFETPTEVSSINPKFFFIFCLPYYILINHVTHSSGKSKNIPVVTPIRSLQRALKENGLVPRTRPVITLSYILPNQTDGHIIGS